MSVKKKVAPKKVAKEPKKETKPAAKKQPTAVEAFKALPAKEDFEPEPPKREKVSRQPKEWRKRQGHDTWHFNPACPNWPTEGFRSRTEAPTTGEKCNTCRAKEARHGDS